MNRSQSIEALLRKARESFGHLRQAYETSLHFKVVSNDLKVDIKNIFENLRSCLDYMAHDIFEYTYPGKNPPKPLYFPIRQSLPDFDAVINKDFSSLKASHRPVYDFLESIQPYHNPWLSQFNDLNNNNKHQDLVEQARTETQEVKVSSPSGSISWHRPGVTFGNGVSVMGVPIDPRTQMPVPNDMVRTEVTIWIDFKFKANGQSVLPFIEKSIESVEHIYTELDKYI
ncbi:MAG: hypothetical protein HY313_11370 [Acidobacteria bacterium]|nr:hypothetical protein [Acidobacteriota bacterium]